MRKNTSNKNSLSGSVGGKPPRARFVAKLMRYMAEEYGVFAQTTQRKQHPHRKKTPGINKKFADQIAQFKEYQTNPTKKKFDKLFNDNLGIVNFTINRWFSHQALSPKRDDMVQE